MQTNTPRSEKNNGAIKLAPIIFSIVLILSFAIVYPIVYSYFTASSRLSGTSTFATLTTNIVNSSGTALTNSTFKTSFLNDELDPGDTIQLKNIKVKNNSDRQVYTLMKLTAEVTKSGSATLTYTKWYSLTGVETYLTNFALNFGQATLQDVNSTADINISFTFPGGDITTEYAGATATLTLGAYSMQSSTQEMAELATGDEANYAAYFITKSMGETVTYSKAQYVVKNYIQGVAGRYIDTNKGANSKSRIEISFQYGSLLSSGYNRIFGERNNDGNGNINIRTSNANGGNLYVEAYPSYTDSATISLDRYDIIIDSLNGDLYLNGVRKSAVRILDSAESYNLYLFGTLNGSTESDVKIFDYKLYDDGVLAQHLIPVVRVSGTKPGMYDVVNGTFFTNAGTGEFTYG